MDLAFIYFYIYNRIIYTAVYLTLSSLKFIFKVPFHAKLIFPHFFFKFDCTIFAFLNVFSGEVEHQDIE